MNAFKRQRAAIYRFLSSLFCGELSAETLGRCKAVRFPESAGENASAPEKAWLLAGQRYNIAANSLQEADLEDLAADYARVFLGAGLAEATAAFPYESVYTSRKRSIMQEAWSRMHALLGSRALELRAPSADLMEDHLSVELEYMAWLVENAAVQEQAEYLDLHLCSWILQLCTDVEKYAQTAFYRACAALLAAYLPYDAWLLSRLPAESTQTPEKEENRAGESVRKSFSVSKAEMEAAFGKLCEKCDVYGPAFGTETETPTLRFRKLHSFAEIVNDRQSDFSAKELYYPISQTLFHFDENRYTTVLPDTGRPMLIFAHPCDINAIRRLDNIFLKNGGAADAYYKALRSRVKFAMLECGDGFKNCFCVSMGTNRADDYALAVKIGENDVQVLLRDGALLPCFDGAAECVYTPSFAEKNVRQARLPQIGKVDSLQKVHDLPMWKDYNDKCISCGGCNTVCPTCSCYETADYLDQENSRKGERRRVWASCMIPDFTRTAGGNVARPTPDKLMRFKVLHKVYDYNERFGGGEQMCVGCGRCILRCPEKIDFLDTVNRLHDETEALIMQQEGRK